MTDPLEILLWALGGKAAGELWLATYAVRRMGELAETLTEVLERLARLEGQQED